MALQIFSNPDFQFAFNTTSGVIFAVFVNVVVPLSVAYGTHKVLSGLTSQLVSAVSSAEKKTNVKN